jgi:hypothetical protein
MQQWFWGYFHKKILRLTLIVSYIKLFIFILIFFCASSEWYSNNQNYEVKQGEQDRVAEMQLTVGPVGPRGHNFRGSGKWRLCVRPNDRQTFLLLGAVKNQISVGPSYLLDP